MQQSAERSGFGLRLRLTAAGVAILSIASLAASTTATASTPAASPRQAPCLSKLPNIGPKTWAQVGRTTELVVVRGESRASDTNTFERWQLRAGGCWVKESSWWALNGYNGWHERPWTGSLRSPIGVFTLTDTGGRLANPGTIMRYHWGPQPWEKGGYRIDYPVQLYNYVVAINYNRRIGQPPRDERQPNPNTGSGYWIHQRGLGSTRGCVSLTQAQLVTLLRWLMPRHRPKVIMGPGPALLR